MTPLGPKLDKESEKFWTKMQKREHFPSKIALKKQKYCFKMVQIDLKGYLEGPDLVWRQNYHFLSDLKSWKLTKIWLEKWRSGENESVFDQKIMKFGFKFDLGWTWGVNLPTFEGPTLFEGHLGSEIFSFEHEHLTRSGKNGSVFDQKSMKFGFKLALRVDLEGQFTFLWGSDLDWGQQNCFGVRKYCSVLK